MAYKKSIVVDKELDLKPIRKSDLTKVRDWKNDKKLSELIMSRFRETSLEDAENWLEKNSSDDNQILLGIYLNHKNMIGIVRVMYIKWDEKEAELGIYIGDEGYRGKGYGTACLRSIIDMMLNEYSFKRLYLKVASSNVHAIRSYTKLGFVEEKVLDGTISLMAINNQGI